MISSKEMKFEQDNPVPNGTVCTALYDAAPEYNIDLDFKEGEKVVIVEPCNVLFFYIGRNSEGKEGVIPINYFTFESNKSTSDDTATNDNTNTASSQPPQVAPKPSVHPRPPGSPVLTKPPVAARTSNTLPSGSTLFGEFRQFANQSAVDDIDRRPPCPLPPEATINQVNPMLATEEFKKNSGWFTPGIQQVWCVVCFMYTVKNMV